MSKVISCTLKSNVQIEDILKALRELEFPNQNISVLLPDRPDTQKWMQGKNTKAPQGLATGLGTGGIVGGVLGWLMGVGSLVIPGVGPFIAAGPIVATLTGTALGAALGGVAGALIGLGVPDYEAKIYETKVKEGLILISVHIADTDLKTQNDARRIFENAGAENVSEIYEDTQTHV